MTFPLPNSAQSSIASSSDNSSVSRSGRSQSSVWGAPPQAPAPRRGLAPLATSNLDTGPASNFGLNSRRVGAASSPGPQNPVTSPLATTFSSVLTSSGRLYPGRQNSSNPSNPSSASPFTPLQAGSQQQPQSGPNRSSPRPRTVTPNSSYYLASSAGTTTSQGGGGGSGGGGGAGTTRSAGFSPSLSGTNIASPTNFVFDRSAIPNSGSVSGGGQSSLSKISTAQVLLLLDSISEKEGKAKWDSKAEQIRKVSFLA